MLTSGAGNLVKLKSSGKYSQPSVVEKQQNRGARVAERPGIGNVPACDLYSYRRDAVESVFGRRRQSGRKCPGISHPSNGAFDSAQRY
jgi:hypothetical protein